MSDWEKHLEADLEEVNKILREMDETDRLGKMSFTSRKEKLEKELSQLRGDF